jgi:hypothetical protein
MELTVLAPTFDVGQPLYGVQAENRMISTYHLTDIASSAHSSAYYPNVEVSCGFQTTQLFSIGHGHIDTLNDPTPTFNGTVTTQSSTHLTAPTEATSARQYVQTNSYLQLFDYSNRVGPVLVHYSNIHDSSIDVQLTSLEYHHTSSQRSGSCATLSTVIATLHIAVTTTSLIAVITARPVRSTTSV